MNNWLLTLLVDSARPAVCGRQVIACRYFKPILTISLSGAAGTSRTGDRLFLTAVASRSGSFVFLSGTDPLAGCPADDVFSRIQRCSVETIDQPRGDRVLRIEFATKEGPPRDARHEIRKAAEKVAGGRASLSILLTLYGHEGGAVLYDGDTIVDRIHRRSSGVPAGRPAVSTPFATVAEASLRSLLHEGAVVPGLDPHLRRLFGPESDEHTAGKLIAFRDSVSSGERQFHLLFADSPAEAVPVPEPAGGAAGEAVLLGPFADARSAAEAIGHRLVALESRKRVADELKPVRSFIARKRALLAKLQAEQQAADRHEDVRRKAETLAAYQASIPPGASTIELPDPYGSGSVVTIALDPSRPISAQIQKLFKRASKLKRSLRFLQIKTEHLQALLRDLENRCASIEAEENVAGVLEAIGQLRKEYQISVPHRREGERTGEKRYRRFDIGPRWFVLVGRDNRENDELTFHVAAPSDYWLHAQQVPGSHVILKSNGGRENPSEAVLETAAGIAAYFSKAKHSSVVPVICTLRKYVRKPRKGKPGQVLCSQMKTVFAEPGLPDERDD
jgi:hypothetical protein